MLPKLCRYFFKRWSIFLQKSRPVELQSNKDFVVLHEWENTESVIARSFGRTGSWCRCWQVFHLWCCYIPRKTDPAWPGHVVCSTALPWKNWILMPLLTSLSSVMLLYTSSDLSCMARSCSVLHSLTLVELDLDAFADKSFICDVAVYFVRLILHGQVM